MLFTFKNVRHRGKQMNLWGHSQVIVSCKGDENICTKYRCNFHECGFLRKNLCLCQAPSSGKVIWSLSHVLTPAIIPSTMMWHTKWGHSHNQWLQVYNFILGVTELANEIFFSYELLSCNNIDNGIREWIFTCLNQTQSKHICF